MFRIIEYLLALFIFLIPWQARWVISPGELNGALRPGSGQAFWEYGTIALYAADVLFLGILVLSVVWIVGRDRSVPPLKITCLPVRQGGVRGVMKVGAWLAFAGYILLSILWSPDRFVAFYASLKLFEGIGLFLILRYFVDDRQKITGAFIASAVVQSVLAIAQFFTQTVYAWPWSGIAPHRASDLGASVVQFADERWLRAYGSFPHPNLLGAFLVLALILLFIQYKILPANLTREPHPSPFLKGEGDNRMRRRIYLLVVCSLILITGLFLTFSRAAWIAAVVAVGIWFFTNGTWRNRLIQQMTLLLITYSLLLTAIFFPLVRTRVLGTENLEQRSTTERTAGYREAWQMIQRHPLLGVGVGNYTKAVHDEIRPNDPSWSYQPIHNVFVLILAELGLVGIGLLALGFWLLFPRLPATRYPLLVSIIILASLDHSFWTLHSGILIFWAFLALSSDFHRHSTPH